MWHWAGLVSFPLFEIVLSCSEFARERDICVNGFTFSFMGSLLVIFKRRNVAYECDMLREILLHLLFLVNS